MSIAVSALPDLYEVINGRVVELPPMSVQSSIYANRLMRTLANFAVDNGLGEAFCELLIAMPDRFEHNRRPDICYLSYQKWPQGKPFPSVNALDVVPELCVEVVSPNDSAEDLREKIEEYFEAGVKLVWVVYPNRQRVDVYSSPDDVRLLKKTDTLTAESILPGFQLPLKELFLNS